MTRWWFGRLRLHIMYRGDVDPDCHDHPWAFWTFPLTPYVEEVVAPHLADGVRLLQRDMDESFICEPSKATRWRQIVPAFRISHKAALHTHRILGRASDIALHWGGHGERIPPSIKDDACVLPGKIITIVWRGKTERDGWGFLKNDGSKWCWRPWKKYVDGGKHVPCE